MKFIQGKMAGAAAASVLTLVGADRRRRAGARQDVRDEDHDAHHPCGARSIPRGFRRAGQKGHRLPHQIAGLSGKPARHHPAPDQKHQFASIQCRTIRPNFCRHRRTVRSAGRSRPGHIGVAGPESRRRSGGLEFYLGLGANKGCMESPSASPSSPKSSQRTRSVISTISRARSCASSPRSSSRRHSAAGRHTGGDVAERRHDRHPARSLDSAVAGVQLLSGLHFFDAAKYITLTNHAAIFYVVEISKKWYDSLPADLQKIVEKDARQLRAGKFQHPRAQEIDNAGDKDLDRPRRRADQSAGGT